MSVSTLPSAHTQFTSSASPSDDPQPLVQINSTLFVKPSRPTRRFNLYLPPSDTFFQNFFYVRDVLFYPLHGAQKDAPHFNIQALKDGLSDALVHFYPVAGRLSYGDNEGQYLTIDCNDAGVEFKEASVEYHFRELQEKSFPILDFYNDLVPPTPDTKDAPLLYIQITSFKDGCGIAIGAAVNHVVFDGSSFWYFFNAWGQCCRGLGVSPPPFHERAVLHPKRWLNGSTPAQDLALPRTRVCIRRQPVGKGHHRVLHFDRQSVEQLKQRAIQESGSPSISSYQAVLASVWKGVVAAQKLPLEHKVCLYLKADLRKRLSSTLTPAYFGNALEGISVDATATDVAGAESNIGAVAARIRKALEVLDDEEYIKGRIGKCKGEEFMKLMCELKDGRTHVLYVIHGPRLPVFDVDMGMGRPLAVRPATILSDPIMFVYPGQEKGSMDVCLRFTSPQTLHTFLSIPSSSTAI